MLLGAAGAGAARALRPLRVQGKPFGKKSWEALAEAAAYVSSAAAVIVGGAAEPG